MEHLFWCHTSQTTPSDPARGHRSQVVKLTSARSVGHLAGHDRAHGGCYKSLEVQHMLESHSRDSLASSGILRFQKKLFHGQKTTMDLAFLL